jgi:hypothetical protein
MSAQSAKSREHRHPCSDERAGCRIVAQAITELTIPADLTGVQWECGTIECRARLLHPLGTLVAEPGDIGVVLTSPDVECDSCSDACSE